ncbi:flavodoxin-dependent (E)-4-hydroxy-3-methylbut-2-enyl-diphosphate synthase [Candidatus Dependentiae bacterium]|nr:flavodoxin-dependent (E)-4-hydroxy-3-methylbut-2-enyl-diphosphate synthase [Candidatus Dependentiae bacterium]
MSRTKKEIKIGGISIGGSAPIAVQSMTNTKTADIKKTVSQIKRLERLGCEIIRVAVPDFASANALPEIKRRINIPLIADIHFDYRLAIKSIENGADKIRINPGNIGDKKRLFKVLDAAKKFKVPIRLGVNSGSIEKSILKRYKHPTPAALVESVLKSLKLFESRDFTDIVISVKSSNVLDTIKAYELLDKKVRYPLHIGITEAGTRFTGAVRSSTGLGILLFKGIGDTLRVSLAGNPEWEIITAYQILRSLGLRSGGVKMIVCPTCGRTDIPVEKIASKIERLTRYLKGPIKIAVMGCVVNGPGEAKDADVGIACGKDKGAIFRKGKIIGTVSEESFLAALIAEINKEL